MKQLIILLLFVSTLNLFGVETLPYKENPTNELNLLIDSTKELLKKQETLKAVIDEYLKLQADALKDPNNRPLLQKTAKIAENALEIIREERLNYLFDTAFISELTLFAKIAKKPSIQPVP